MRFLSFLLPVAAFATSALAAPSFPIPLATFRAVPPEFHGDSTMLRVHVAIPKGWHIQSDAPLDDFLIPTELKASGEGLRFGKAEFPKPLVRDLPTLGGKVALFEDTIDVRLPVKRAKSGVDAKALEKAIVTLRYQACNDSQCLPPKVVTARFIPGK